MMALESIALNKISQIQKGKGCVPFPYVGPCGAGSRKAEGTVCLVDTNNKNVKSNWVEDTGAPFPLPPPALLLSQAGLTCGSFCTLVCPHGCLALCCSWSVFSLLGLPTLLTQMSVGVLEIRKPLGWLHWNNSTFRFSSEQFTTESLILVLVHWAKVPF